MNPDRLTGFVYPVKTNGVPVRGRWQPWVNLPSEPAFDKDGAPVLPAGLTQRRQHPGTQKAAPEDGRVRAATTRPKALPRSAASSVPAAGTCAAELTGLGSRERQGQLGA